MPGAFPLFPYGRSEMRVDTSSLNLSLLPPTDEVALQGS